MAESVYTGTRWGTPGIAGTPAGAVTWSFNLEGARFYGFDGAITSEAYRILVRSAFDAWERVAAIDFVEVATGSADIQIGIDAIDGRGSVLGEARWSFSGSMTTHAEIAIDSAEVWSPFVAGGSNFYALVVHEIGHTIGLDHTSDPGSIMYPYIGAQQGPSAADIAAIQALYGPAGAAGRLIAGTPDGEALYGQVGNDTIDAGAGNDIVYGFAGIDLVYGGTGDDYIQGGDGNDTLTGNQDNDRVYGGFGNDLVYGGRNDDLVLGNQGEDTVTGNEGDDTVYGGFGNDLVYGGQGNDVVYGNQGRDTIHGGTGSDTLIGSEDADLFQFGAGDGNDTIVDFRAAEGDRLSLGGQSYSVSEVGGSAVLNLSGGGAITLLGVTGSAFEPAALV